MIGSIVGSMVGQAKDLRQRQELRRRRLPAMRTGRAGGGLRLLYLPPPAAGPFGGIRVMYQHVEALRRMGVDAAILVRPKQSDPAWFATSAPVLGTQEVVLGGSDVLVLPEWNAPFLHELPAGVRCLVFDQGPYYTFSLLDDDPAQPIGPYAHPSVVGLMTVSHDGVALLRHTFPRLPVHYARPPIDPGVFHPAPTAPGRRIGYLARSRRAEDRDFVLRILRNRDELRGWELVPISGTQQEVAAGMRSCAIFLAFGFREGFGLPTAEAMASGCHVVGYAAMGGRELFDLAPSSLVAECDVRAYAVAVRRALDAHEADPAAMRADGERAAALVAETYAPARLEEDLAAVVTDLSAGPGDRRTSG